VRRGRKAAGLVSKKIVELPKNKFSASEDALIIKRKGGNLMKLKSSVIFLTMFVLILFTPAYAYDQRDNEGAIANELSATSVQAGTPKISVTPTSVNFGSVQIGSTSSSKMVTISNKGTSDLVISSINIGGANASDFTQTNSCTTIPQKSSCSVTVTFAPKSIGNESAAMGISSNDPKKPTVNVRLSGKAKSPVCTYSLTSSSQQCDASGGTWSVNVNAPSGCGWTAATKTSWITITSGRSGSGDGTVTYTVAPNTGTGQRTGTITIAKQTFTVTQSGSGGGRTTSVWTDTMPGTIFNGDTHSAGQTTYLTVVIMQSGNSLSGIWGFKDTLGRSGSSSLTGSISGNNFTVQNTDLDPSCASRTHTETGTLTAGATTLTFSYSAPAAGSCPALSGTLTFTLVTPTTYTASGTYTYNSAAAALTIDTTSSNFPPDEGPPKTQQTTGVSITSTTMTWPNDNMTWTRASGTAGDITGTWTAVDFSYGEFISYYQLTFNSNGSWSLVANIISGGNQNPYADSEHWSNGSYYVGLEYDDPNKTATSVAVTGPGITGSLSLPYDTNSGQWNSWASGGNPVYFGTTHPAAPLSYTFTITGTSGTKTATATVGCFMEVFATNLSVAKDASGNTVFSWTKVPYNNMHYSVDLLNANPSLPDIWDVYDLLDASSVTYTGPALKPGTTYGYYVGVSDSSDECMSITNGMFTVQSDGTITNGQ
jgi:hypothetical protein